ncbi:hypothetical protein [Sphaerisporangium sp. NBC_01403]|uniref:aromatic-ring hydroxylase C-terminal domain-containing protein n=1 Tax=Sphaerisporangium sp. NBC_01403 TaxID=2903599 RepID=UPI003864CBE5
MRALGDAWADRVSVTTAKSGPSMLVRPDGHVVGTTDPAPAEQALRTWLGTPALHI